MLGHSRIRLYLCFMSLTESEILKNIGLVFLDNIAELTTFAFLHGAAVLIFCASTRLLIKKGLKTLPTRIMLATSSLSFLLVTVYIAAFLALFIVEIKGAFVDPFTAGQLNVTRLEAVNMRTFILEMLFSWSSLLPPIINNTIVIWRAWVLYTHKRWVLIWPIALLLGSFAVSLTYSILTSSYSSFTSSKVAWSPCSFVWSNRRHNPYNIYIFLAIVLSFSTNVFTTVLILFKLRRFQGSFSLGPSRKRTRAQKIIVILVDSGLIYCGFQLIFLSMAHVPFTRLSKMNTVYSVLFPIYLVFTGMYPSIVVVLVGHERSVVESFGFSESRSSGVDLENRRPARPANADDLTFAPFLSENDTDDTAADGGSAGSAAQDVHEFHTRTSLL